MSSKINSKVMPTSTVTKSSLLKGKFKSFMIKHKWKILLGVIVGIVIIYIAVSYIFNHNSGVQEIPEVAKDIILSNQYRVGESYDVSEGFSNYKREGFREGLRRRGKGKSKTKTKRSKKNKNKVNTNRQHSSNRHTSSAAAVAAASQRTERGKRGRRICNDDSCRVFNGSYMLSPTFKCTWDTCQKLINYQIMGSFNSCAKTNVPGSCTSTIVSKEDLTNVLLTGFRFIDFEIYSIKGNIVVGIGGEKYQYTVCPTDPGQEATLNRLKDNGTYGITDHPKYPFIPIKEALEIVKSVGFGQAGNKNDPLFILFRIKSFDSKIYIALETAIKNVLGQHLLPNSYGRDGELLGNNRPITKLPLYAVKRKAIICVEDHCKLYKQPEAKGCFDLINMLAGENYLRTYTYQEILDADTGELRKESHKRIIVGFPQYETNDSLKQAWGNMHLKGVQVAMIRYRTIVCDKNQNFVQSVLGNEETNENGYIDYFATNGAFKLKDQELLPEPEIISKDIQPRTSPKEKLTADTEHTDALGNRQKFRGAGR